MIWWPVLIYVISIFQWMNKLNLCDCSLAIPLPECGCGLLQWGLRWPLWFTCTLLSMQTRTGRKKKEAFSFCAPNLWNKPPETMESGLKRYVYHGFPVNQTHHLFLICGYRKKKKRFVFVLPLWAVCTPLSLNGQLLFLYLLFTADWEFAPKGKKYIHVH